MLLDAESKVENQEELQLMGIGEKVEKLQLSQLQVEKKLTPSVSKGIPEAKFLVIYIILESFRRFWLSAKYSY